ncbi:MAG TPA: BamA/TamA family outer membrane protein [Gemmatimonadales bacterium]
MRALSGTLPLALCAAVPLTAGAQGSEGYAAYAGEPQAVVTVTGGEHYAAGALHRMLFGAHYRDLWATPIEVPVLDLESFAGGLTPEERGGGQQTRSLHFESGDGREFSFRSVDKDPTEAVPEQFRGTVVHRLVQDATSAANPGGALVAPVLLEAAGVLHAPPSLVVLPDHERLGEHRAEFAGLLGTIEERPGDGFAGALEVQDTDDLFERLRESPDHRVDAAAFLTARLVDHLLGDWDRHADQWRWAAFRQGGRTVYRPIPRDRDQALARYDGLVTTLARKHNPKLTTFGPEYPDDLVGFTWNGRELDRAILTPLDGAAFDSVARALQAALTDSVIAAAVGRLPSAYRARWGSWTADALRRRRDALPRHAARYYGYLATDVDVRGTDAAELAEARWEGGALHLRLREAAGGTPYFDRRFIAGETEEVRLHLREGADRVRLAGERRGPRLRIVREPRDSVLGPGDAGRVALHDHIPEPPAADTATGSAVPDAPRDWGGDFGVGPRAGYDPDLGLLLGAGAGWTDYAFRREPYGSRTEISAVYATAADGLRAELAADLRRRNPRTRFALLVRASEIEVVRFSGLGNETPDVGEAAEVDHWQLTVAPSLVRELSPSLRVRAGPVLSYATTDRRESGLPRGSRVRGADGFGRLGASAELALESGPVEAVAGGGVYPPIWSGNGTFGELHGEARVGVPLGSPSLAGRLGARRVWGPFPYDEAAFLGGARTLRGYAYQRFAGDAMVYGGIELRVPLARVLSSLVPTRVGLIALADAGRVWAEGTRSGRVHAAAGGGIWLEFFEAKNTLSLVYARGREGGRWYFQIGLPY